MPKFVLLSFIKSLSHCPLSCVSFLSGATSLRTQAVLGSGFLSNQRWCWNGLGWLCFWLGSWSLICSTVAEGLLERCRWGWIIRTAIMIEYHFQVDLLRVEPEFGLLGMNYILSIRTSWGHHNSVSFVHFYWCFSLWWIGLVGHLVQQLPVA